MPTIHRRLAVATVIGLLAGLFVPLGPADVLLPRILLGFVIGGLTFAVPLLLHLLGHDAPSTRRHVAGRDADAAWYDLVIIIVELASLCGVVVLLIGGQAIGAAQVIEALIGLGAVAVGWLCVHTIYVLRYARIYYASDEAPIDFKQEADPTFSDFAYFSFNLGMAYQVSDTDLKTSQIRSVVLGHTMLAYVYGTIIIAASINLVAGLGSSGG